VEDYRRGMLGRMGSNGQLRRGQTTIAAARTRFRFPQDGHVGVGVFPEG